MRTVTVITPVLDHPEFIPAFAAATRGAEVVIVDTGSTAENHAAWATTTTRVSSYPHSGHNYGHWCNAGYAESTGDIVIFLNNDVEATGDWLSEVAEQVKDGAIYGPELAAQYVAGLQVPFLSGWCIAAMRETWNKLKILPPKGAQHAFEVVCSGPWNTLDYPAAGYWEDNDLCFRAVMAGIELQQVAWPIVHLDGGNGTSKHAPAYYASVARNKATFERAVREAMQHA